MSSTRKERSRALILDAADALFRERGISAVSMEEIAATAGLTRKTVYNLFAAKEAIALALIARVETGEAGYRARMAAGDDARALLETVLLDSAGWCLANPALARLALAPPTPPGLEPPEGRPSFQRLVRDILVLGQAQGTIRSDEPAGFMALVLLGAYAQAMLAILGGAAWGAGEIRHLLRIVLEGIGKP